MSKKPARLHNKKPCAGTGWRTEQQTLCSYGTLDDYLDPNAVIDYVKDNLVIAEMDHDFTIRYISVPALKALGYSGREMQGVSGGVFSVFAFAQNQKSIKNSVFEQLECDGLFYCNFEVEKGNGNYKWVAVYGQKVRLNDGVVRLCCFVSETDYLNYYTECYREVLEGLGYIVCEYDVQDDTVTVPKEAARIIGSEACTIRSLTEKGFAHHDSAKTLKRMITDIQNDKRMSKGIIKLGTPDSDYMWYECCIFCTRLKGVNKDMVLLKNINKQLVKEQNLKNERQFHKAILSGAIRIYKIDVTNDMVVGGHEDWDKRFCISPTGCYTDMMSEISSKSIHPDDAQLFLREFSRDNILHMFKNGQTEIVLELRRAEVDKPFLWIKCTMTVFCDPDTKNIVGIVAIKNIERRKKREAEMQYLAERDSLSKLYNRGATEQRIKEYLDTHEGQNGQHALMIMDIDNFKDINDTQGHLQGDNILIKIAYSIQDIFRSTDILGRVGGDEFVLFIKNISSTEKAARKAQEVNRAIQSLGLSDKSGLTVSVSVGVAICPAHGTTFGILYNNADTALYKAKRSGKNTYALYDCE